MSRITSNNAIANLHLADLFDGLAMSIGRDADILNRDVSTTKSPIIIDSTKNDVSLRRGTSRAVEASDFNTTDTACSRCRITRDGAVDEGERACIIDAAD